MLTVPDNMTLLCDYHHRLLHEGAFSVVKERGDALRFVTADGRTIPRNGYRLEDFVDDDIGRGGCHADASRDGSCTTAGQRDFARDEVREARVVYRLRWSARRLGESHREVDGAYVLRDRAD